MTLDSAHVSGWVALTVLGALAVVAALVIRGLDPRPREDASTKPQHPLWEKPREFSALFDRELFDALHPRLERLANDERASLWRDKTSGQLWSALAYDYEFTENVVYTPIQALAEWQGMPKNH